jgi:hypothetical protein
MMDDDADEPQRHTIYNIQTTVWIPIPNGWEQSGVVEDLLARCSRRRAASLHRTKPNRYLQHHPSSELSTVPDLHFDHLHL